MFQALPRTHGSTARAMRRDELASRSEIRLDNFRRAARLRSLNTRESACLGEEPYANATEPGSTLRKTSTQRTQRLLEGEGLEGDALAARLSDWDPLVAELISRGAMVLRTPLGVDAIEG